MLQINTYGWIVEEFVLGEVFAEIKPPFVSWSPHIVDLTDDLVVLDASFYQKHVSKRKLGKVRTCYSASYMRRTIGYFPFPIPHRVGG